MGQFKKVTPDELSPMAVVAQSLDNQWVPPGLLRRMLEDGLELNDVRAQLRQEVRAEYIRALVNSPQVIVNRAFFYNNPLVFEDFVPGTPDRDAFLALLNSGALVQLLLTEQTPVDPPAFLENQATPNYTLLEHGWQAWTAAAEESHVHSLRFSWTDDRANQDQVRHRFATRFTNQALTLVNLDAARLAIDLGTDLDTALRIKNRLSDVTARCADYAARNEFATRERLYKEFVTAEGTAPALGRYDRGRAFCAEVKQLIDLAYSVNSATGLKTLALTPSQALHRSALQEWEAVRRGSDPVSAAQLAQLLRGTAFDFVQETLFLDTFAKLSMRDVWDIRNSHQWDEYVRRMRRLLGDPLAMFDDPYAGAPSVVRAYLDLLGETTRIATARRRPGRPDHRAREFAAIISVEVAGAVLECEIAPDGLAVALAGAVAAPFVAEAARLTVRLGLRARRDRRDRKQFAGALDAQTQILNEWVESGGRFWAELIKELGDIPGMAAAERALKEQVAAVEGEPKTDLRDVL
ncbi:MAG TPA: hypothetical protein VE465_03020 [Streptosporangiaceae bacterium]|jgi:hypothetical protein|nr:hypothetical protein [Streptosporangiaceae bacterium]